MLAVAATESRFVKHPKNPLI